MFLLYSCFWFLAMVCWSVQSSPSQPSEILLQIAVQFKGWDFLVHIDDQPEVFQMPMHNHTDNPLTIFNYTACTDDSAWTFYRPFIKRGVHFVMYTNTEFATFAKLYGNINEDDVVVFLSERMPRNENYMGLYDSGVDNANSVFMVDRNRALAIFFYSAPDMSVLTKEVVKDQNGVPQLSKFMNTFTNFHGFPLKIGFTNCAPYVYDRDLHEDGDTDHDLVGVEYEVLKAVCKKLNINPVMDNFSAKENARRALIKAVNRSTLHFAMGCLSNNIRRNEMVFFSSSLQIEPQITVYASPDGRYGPPALYAVVAPLKSDVWICCIVSLIFISLLVELLMILFPPGVGFASSLLPTKILLEQATFIPRHSNALRFGLFTWILVGYALSSAYKSKLTAALIMPEMNEPVTLKDLLDQGYHFISPAMDSTYLIEVLQDSADPVEHQIGMTIEDTKDVCDAFYRALREISAIIEERSVLRYMLWNICKFKMTKKEMRAMRRLDADATANGHAWAMPKAAPFKDTVSMVLERMQSYGLIQKWYGAYNLSRPLIHSNARTKPDQLAMTVPGLLSAWIIIGFGTTVSIGVFLIELFVTATKRVDIKGLLVHTDSQARLTHLKLQPVLDTIGAAVDFDNIAVNTI